MLSLQIWALVVRQEAILTWGRGSKGSSCNEKKVGSLAREKRRCYSAQQEAHV